MSDECLDKIARVFGQEQGYYTAPRKRRSPNEAAEDLISRFGELQPVDVRPLRTQPQIRALAMCDGCLINKPGLGDVLHSEDYNSRCRQLSLLLQHVCLKGDGTRAVRTGRGSIGRRT